MDNSSSNTARRALNGENINRFQKYSWISIWLVGLGWAAFQLVSAWLLGFHDLIQLPVHVAFAVAMALVGYSPKGKRRKNTPVPFFDLFLAAVSLALAFYLVANHERMAIRMPFVDEVTFTDKILGLALIILLLEACRRTLGWVLTIIAIVFIGYGFLGSYMIGPLRHSGLKLTNFIDILFLSTGGIFGSPTAVSANMVYYFVLIGALLQQSGAGELFVSVAYYVTGSLRGGSGKASVISSSLFGTVSGSAVANVLVDGIFTIPLMKKTGFPSHMAAAIEAAASTGGQLAPPVMGAAAFILAQIVGVPYKDVVLAAIVPAILYFFSLYVVIDLYSRRHGLQSLKEDERSKLVAGMKERLHLFIPLIYLVYLIFQDYSLMTVGINTIAAIIITSLFRPISRMGIRSILEAFVKGSSSAVHVAIPCAIAGILIGIIANTGLVMKFKEVLIMTSGGSLIAALVVAMILTLFLGVGMPTAPAYILAAILVAPAIQDLGVPVLAAHLFLFYFAVISMITPPVALAAFAAASIGEANMWKTGFAAFTISISSFLIPFAFAFDQGLLLKGTVTHIVWVVSTTTIGVCYLSSAIVGYCFGECKIIERGLLAISAFLLIVPEPITDIIGLIIALAITTFKFCKNQILAKKALTQSI